jgi:hypothetical protein
MPFNNKTHEMAAWQMDVDERITHGLEKALEMGLCRKGEPVICVIFSFSKLHSKS